MTRHLLLETWDELARAQRQRVILALAALESHPAAASLEIYNRDVALLGGPALHRDQPRVALGHSGQLLVHRGVLRHSGQHLNRNALVLPHGRFRLLRHGDFELRAVLAYADEVEVVLVRDVAQPRLLYGGFQLVRVDDVQRVLVEDVLPVKLLDYPSRGLAAPEPGDVHLLYPFAVGLLHRRFERFRVDGDV